MKDLHYYYHQSDTLFALVGTNDNYNSASTNTTSTTNKDEDTCSTLLSEDDDSASKETMREYYNSVLLNSMPDHIVYYNDEDDTIAGEDDDDCFDDCNEKDQYFKVSTHQDEDFLENFGGTFYNILNNNDNKEEDDLFHSEDENYENLFNIELSMDIDFPASSSSSSLRRRSTPKTNLMTSAVAPTKPKQRRVSRERLQELSKEISHLRQRGGGWTHDIDFFIVDFQKGKNDHVLVQHPKKGPKI